MVSSRLKGWFEGVVSAGVRPLASAGLTPNSVTALGLVVGFASAACYYLWRESMLLLPAAGGLVLLSGLLDAVDGVVARTTGKVTAFGGFFDSVADRYSDAAAIAGVSLSGLCDPVWGVLAIVGSLMVSYTRSRAEAAGVKMAGIGIAERAERMVILAVSTFASLIWVDALGWGIVLIAILAHLTVVQRVLHFRNESKLINL